MRNPIERLLAPAGTLLFAEGEDGAVAYLIKSGRVDIFITRAQGELILATRGPGEIIGEMAIIDAQRRSASARATADCELTPITSQQFTHRIAQTDPVLRMCLGIVLARYRQAVAMIEQTAQRRRRDQWAQPSSDEFAAATRALSLEGELSEAIRLNELELHFQPIVRLADNRLTGFEALMRWRHPERGLLGPDHFIPVAEASGLIADLTSWCLGEVGRLAPEIMLAALANARAVGPLYLALNVSGHDLARAAFPDEFERMLRRSGVSPSNMQIEITESVMMKDPAGAVAVLDACRKLGTSVAIDDFGTGYSSLSHLSTLPITTLKIDRSFVHSMLANPTSRKIVHMILRLADELDIPVVAEGIEEEAEATALAAMGCGFGQGYLFAKPLPLDEAIALTRGWTLLAKSAARQPDLRRRSA